MSFLRHQEIYHFDEGAIPQDHALAHHRNDEFPAGYSSAGCSPAVPASASPAGAIMRGSILYSKKFAANGKLSPITVSQPWGSLQHVKENSAILEMSTSRRIVIRSLPGSSGSTAPRLLR